MSVRRARRSAPAGSAAEEDWFGGILVGITHPPKTIGYLLEG